MTLKSYKHHFGKLLVLWKRNWTNLNITLQLILEIIHHVLEEGNDQSELMIWSYGLANISLEDLGEWASHYGHHCGVLPKLPILQVSVGIHASYHMYCIWDF